MEISKKILAVALFGLFLTACGSQDDKAAPADTAQTTEQAPADATEQAPADAATEQAPADATEQAPADDKAKTQ